MKNGTITFSYKSDECSIEFTVPGDSIDRYSPTVFEKAQDLIELVNKKQPEPEPTPAPDTPGTNPV